MAFNEIQFPTTISYGSQGGPGFSTAIVETDSGAEERVQRWSAPRRKYNVSYGVKSKQDLSALAEFYIARGGPANGFRYKDWLDFTSASDHISTPANTDQEIGTGDASETQFQLVKEYVSGVTTVTRNIRKPVSGTVVIAFDGVDQPAGWSVDTTTGIVTFSAAPGAGVVITAGFEFDVPVRFGKEVDDVLSLSIEDFNIGSTSIPLIELIDEIEVPNDYNYGGAASLSISESTQLALSTGRTLIIDATVGSLKVYLPDSDGLPPGGIYFIITGDSGTNDFDVSIDDVTTLATVGDGDSIIILLSEDRIWYAI